MNAKNLVSAVLVAVALSSSGCQRDVSAFVGTWSASGSQTMTFQTPNGSKTDTLPLSGNREVVEGEASDLVLLLQGCNLPANVEERTATVTPGFTCTLNTGSATLSLTFQSGTVVAAKNSLNVSLSATFVYVYQGTSYPGTMVSNETLTRVGK